MADVVTSSFLCSLLYEELLHKNIIWFRKFYESIPSHQWRCLVDKQFPSLAKSETADFISGGNHRWKGGHDLFMDVLPEDVAHAVNSPDIIAVFSKFFPQLLHQSINGPHITCIIVFPHRIQYVSLGRTIPGCSMK